MFAHAIVRNAYLAGTFVALACGMVGWFAVLRAQVFAGDALSHVAFVGAILAAVLGFDERVGLFALTVFAALAMAGLGHRGAAGDVEIGILFAWTLGLGILLITILATSSDAGQGITAANTLFGSIYSLSAGASRLAAAVGLLIAAGVLACFRPLLFATLDGEQAAVRGVPVRWLGAVFLGLLAGVTAESAQAVGTLLLLGLLAAPAGAAHHLTTRPLAGLLLSGALAVAAVWGGLALSYQVSSLPASSAIIGLAASTYVAAAAWSRARRRPWRAGEQTGRESLPGRPPTPQEAARKSSR
jgi:zinc/manganese transport system permease protein